MSGIDKRWDLGPSFARADGLIFTRGMRVRFVGRRPGQPRRENLYGHVTTLFRRAGCDHAMVNTEYGVFDVPFERLRPGDAITLLGDLVRE